jgi:hypothetical protein
MVFFSLEPKVGLRLIIYRKIETRNNIRINDVFTRNPAMGRHEGKK